MDRKQFIIFLMYIAAMLTLTFLFFNSSLFSAIVVWTLYIICIISLTLCMRQLLRY